MERVPPVLVVTAVPMVIGVTWWLGTRDHDFLQAPSVTEIETAKYRATAEMARPSDLFGIESVDAETEPPSPPPPEPPKPKPRAPQIDISDPTSPAPPDAWTERTDLPAASFIELASRLESDAHLGWARVTWERVIDLADSSAEDVEVAVRAIGRIRATMAPPEQPPGNAPRVKLVVEAPGDRIELTRRAAEEAAEILEMASDRAASFVATVKTDDSEEPGLRVALLRPGDEAGEIGSIASEAPADPEVIRRTILQGCFTLIASALATSEELNPIPPPRDGETAAEALSHRVTRRA